MLTIAKLRSGPGSIDYYLQSVAAGIEDYYAGKGEAPGRWIGPAAERLGLDGDIDNDTLGDLMSGRLPGTDTRLGSARKNRTPGWDLTWSSPKSVSVLYGLTDPATSAEVVAAHDTAVAEGLKYLDRWGVVSRRTVDGEVRGVETNGMLVAGFRHRTSRNMDPQLHTHAIVDNIVERGDGTWGAIDSRVFYRHAKPAGYLYQAVLRSELTRRLGVEWGPITNGHAEATAVPTEVNELFSSRRQEIEAELDARGASSARAAQVAALRSRTAKTHVAGTDVLRGTWREHATDADLTIDNLDRNIRRTDPQPLMTVSRRQRRLVNDELMGAAGLTESKPSFNRADIVRAWCERIDPRTIDVDIDIVDELVAGTLTDNRRVLLGNGDPLHGVADPRRWSTTELVTLEHHIVDRVIDGRHTNTVTVDPRAATETIADHPSLSDEQARMIKAITTGGHRIDAVIGVAGSGKTYALGVANTIWTGYGYRPIGVAYAGKTARGLQAGSGIESQTIDRLLTQLDRPGHPGLAENSIIVVDEAGMVPTRKLAQLLDHCRPDTKIVLVGDHHQLPEIGAGGVLRGIVERIDDLPTLTENRRQHHRPERDALAELRDGDVGTGLDWYIDSGR
ncbi:MAG: MobF family relaxase, partial [Actinomycetota bacterium]